MNLRHTDTLARRSIDRGSTNAVHALRYPNPITTLARTDRRKHTNYIVPPGRGGGRWDGGGGGSDGGGGWGVGEGGGGWRGGGGGGGGGGGKSLYQ